MFSYLSWVLRRRLIGLVTLWISASTVVSAFGIARGESAGSETAQDEPSAPVDDSNPYSAIIRANVFRLSEPPKAIEKPDQTLATLPKVNISGFIRHADQPVRALFATVPKDPKDLPRYFNLAEGERDDILEVLKISDNQESVQVVIAGTPVTLTTKSNSFVPPIVPLKPGAPGAPAPMVAGRPSVPQAVSGAPMENSGNVIVAGGMAPSSSGSSVTTIGAGMNTYSGGTMSSGGGSTYVGGGSSIASASPAVPSSSSALHSIPTRGGPSLPNYPPVYTPANMQEAAALSVVDSQIHASDIQNGNYPPPPPVPH